MNDNRDNRAAEESRPRLGAKQEELGTKPLGKLLMSYALPAIIAMTATSLYNMVDSIFIGHSDGSLGLAGLTVTFPLMNLSGAFGAMVGVGAGSVIAVRLGQREVESAENTLGNVVLLNVVIGTLFALVSLIFLEPILRFFGASDASLPYATSYMEVLLYGNVLTHLYLGLNDCVRSSGYPSRAMVATLTAVVVNIGLDYLFIDVFGWGIRGAAWATLTAQALAFLVVVSHLARRSSVIHFKRSIFLWRPRIVRAIISVGCAPFCINLCACLVVLLINNGLLEHGGDTYISAFGILNRVAFIFIMITQGINQGMQPISGFNYGAGSYHRSVRVYLLALVGGTAVLTTGFILGVFFPEFIVSWFSDDAALTEISCHAMRYGFSVFPFIGLQVVTVGFLMSLGKAPKAILLSLTRQLICLVPLLLILPPWLGADGIWVSLPISDGISSVLAAFLAVGQVRQLRRMAAEQGPAMSATMGA